MSARDVIAFHKAWGNEGFSADTAYLTQLLELLDSGPVLECGTGATTLMENEAGMRKGFATFCLEQDVASAEVVHWGLQAVTVVDAPLRNYGSYHWYEVKCALPRHFSVIVCDGPYIDHALGEPHYSAWRYGIMRWLKDTTTTFDKLLLDDVNDPRAPAILARWQEEFGVKVRRIPSAEGELAVVTP